MHINICIIINMHMTFNLNILSHINNNIAIIKIWETQRRPELVILCVRRLLLSLLRLLLLSVLLLILILLLLCINCI